MSRLVNVGRAGTNRHHRPWPSNAGRFPPPIERRSVSKVIEAYFPCKNRLKGADQRCRNSSLP